MASAAAVTVRDMRVDGGAAVMDFMLQMQADLLGVDVLRPQELETTAMGAAFLAGLAEGVWPSLEDVSAAWHLERTFHPEPNGGENARFQQWRRAVERSLNWA
jgi:glycerol kinase